MGTLNGYRTRKRGHIAGKTWMESQFWQGCIDLQQL